VEFLEKGLGKREATGLISSMMDTAKPKKISIATSSLAEAQPQKVVECWTCGEAGHVRGDPKCSKRKGGGPVKAKRKVEATKSGDKTTDKEKKPMICSHCGRSGHSHENCFVLHPEKRPGASGAGSNLVKFLQAEVAELKKTMGTMASLG
jgi:RecJ-like exonuclease